ncbi:hypothetical protein PoB_000103300 [Plakobranchus ocellatus]|uniref:Uncharacterized protein n=1 Tax=Plakobranchus ocellatus TaxID=259542 RepID=A0AAV3XX14_9GAST|nr:hypothetical protein PoB_000103300 [Plakobranchus ocellatus]
MSDKSTQRKEDYLDWMQEKFCASSRAFNSAVKAALRSHTRENAAEIFERAIDVLSQDFPDPTCGSSNSSSSSSHSASYSSECVSSIKATERRQGQHLHTLGCRSGPCRLALLDSSSISQTVAVTLPRCSSIDILEVAGGNRKVKFNNTRIPNRTSDLYTSLLARIFRGCGPHSGYIISPEICRDSSVAGFNPATRVLAQ